MLTQLTLPKGLSSSSSSSSTNQHLDSCHSICRQVMLVVALLRLEAQAVATQQGALGF